MTIEQILEAIENPPDRPGILRNALLRRKAALQPLPLRAVPARPGEISPRKRIRVAQNG